MFRPKIALLFLSCIGQLLVAQDRPPTDVDTGTLIRRLDETGFDARAFLALVDRGRAAVPGLLDLIDHTDATDEEMTRRRHTRAFRALRMLDPGCSGLVLKELSSRVESIADADFDELIETNLAVAAQLPRGDDMAIRAAVDVVLESMMAQLQPRRGGSRRKHGDLLLDLVRFHVRRTELQSAALDAQIKELESKDPTARELAAECIGRRGAEAQSALEPLRAQMTAGSYPTTASFRTPRLSGNTSRDFSTMIRDAVSTAIARIAPQDPLARRGHALLLHADDPRERVAAAMALGASADKDAVDVSTELLDATRDDDPLVAAEAVTALGRVGESSRAIQTRLKELESGGGELGTRAKIALKRLEPAAVRDRK